MIGALITFMIIGYFLNNCLYNSYAVDSCKI